MDMTWIEDVRKWFLAPKTIKGIAGMVVIVIVLALDFAYWAGAIKVTDLASGDDEEIIEVNVTYKIEKETPLDVTDSITIPGLIGEPSTSVNFHPFTVKENASEAIFNLTLENYIGARPDLDLYVYSPDGEEFAAASESADETLTLSEKIMQRKGPGEWQAKVKAYSGWQLTYHLTGDIMYKLPMEEGEAEGGE